MSEIPPAPEPAPAVARPGGGGAACLLYLAVPLSVVAACILTLTFSRGEPWLVLVFYIAALLTLSAVVLFWSRRSH